MTVAAKRLALLVVVAGCYREPPRSTWLCGPTRCDLSGKYGKEELLVAACRFGEGHPRCYVSMDACHTAEEVPQGCHLYGASDPMILAR